MRFQAECLEDQEWDLAKAAVNGITAAYDSAGDGDAVLVLIHGHPFNRSMWRPQIAALPASGWRVIAPDLRGYGETTIVPGTTTLDVFARDIVGLVDALGVGRFVAVGLSMGGQIAMEVARLFPDRLRGIVLAATFPQAETEEGRARRNAMADRLLREGMQGYADETLAKMVAPRNIAAMPDVAEHVLTMMRTASPEGAAAALRGRAERPPYEPVLSALDIPGLVIVGDEDAFTTRADADLMHSLLKTSTLVWMNGVGHMPNLERPAEFNAAMERFLSRLAQG